MHGPTVVITDAGSGIGKAMALGFLGDGAYPLMDPADSLSGGGTRS